MQKIWSFLCENHEKLGMGNIKFCILIYSIVIINANPSTAITGINLRDFEINHLVSRSIIAFEINHLLPLFRECTNGFL